MTVRERIGEDIRTGTKRVIYAAVEEICVICGSLQELRYGVCFDCSEHTNFDDPRVLRDNPIGRMAR